MSDQIIAFVDWCAQSVLRSLLPMITIWTS